MNASRTLSYDVVRDVPRVAGGKQILGLDILRCLAAVMVMMFHLGYWFWAGNKAHGGYEGYRVTYEWAAPFLSFGWVGVEVFFVLSGFVIAYSASAASPTSFLRGRLLRLVPAAWVCSTLTLAVMVLSGIGPWSLLHSLRIWVYTLAFHPLGPWIDWSYWTLGIEVSFYALIFAILLFRKLPLMPLIIGVIGLCSAAFWIVRLAASVWHDAVPGVAGLVTPSSDLAERLHDLLLLNHGCFFAVGVFLWLAAFKGLRSRYRLMLPVLVAGGLAEIVMRTSIVNGLADTGFSPLVPCAVWIGCLGLIWASIAFNAVLLRRLGWFAPMARVLGLMTYPLYLLHQVIGFTLLDLAHGWASDGMILLAVVALLLVLAYGVSAWIEPVVRRLMSRALAPAFSG